MNKKSNYNKGTDKKGESRFGFLTKAILFFVVVIGVALIIKNHIMIKNFISDTFTSSDNKTEQILKKSDVKQNQEPLALEDERDDSEIVATTADISDTAREMVSKLAFLLDKYPQSEEEITEFIKGIASSDQSEEELRKLFNEFVTKLENNSKSDETRRIDKSKDSFYKNILLVDETYTSSDFDVSFRGVEEVASKSTPKGLVLVLVKFEINNKSDDELAINRARFDVYVDGITTSRLYSSDNYKFPGRKDKAIDGKLSPGGKITGYLICEFPENWNSLYIEFSPKQKNICFMELNRKQTDSDFALTKNNDKLEVELEDVTELKTKELEIDFSDKGDLAKTDKVLKVDLKITTGNNKSSRVRDLNLALFINGSSTEIIKRSKIKNETNRLGLAENLTYGRIAPRSELRTYLLCAIPEGWEELKLSYQTTGKTTAKKQWLEWKNKKASTNK